MDHSRHQSFVPAQIGPDDPHQVDEDEGINKILDERVHFRDPAVPVFEHRYIFKGKSQAGQGHRSDQDIEDHIHPFYPAVVLHEPFCRIVSGAKSRRFETRHLSDLRPQPLFAGLGHFYDDPDQQQSCESITQPGVQIPNFITIGMRHRPCLVFGNADPFFLQLLLHAGNVISCSQ